MGGSGLFHDFLWGEIGRNGGSVIWGILGILGKPRFGAASTTVCKLGVTNMKHENFKGRLLRSSVLAGVAASVAIMAAPAYAQDGEIEEIFVTGSRIKQSSFDGPNPVIVFSAEDIEKSGQMSVADVLRDSTLNSFGSFRESSGNSWQSQANIDLRGFGASRTLVMMDGMRAAASPKMGGSIVNMNAIPTAAIERVDILTGAASSIYGSDAAAGVVNIILRDSYDGLTISGMQTWTAEEGGEEKKVSLVTGFESDRARVMIALDYSEREIIYRSDRWYDGVVNGNQDDYMITDGLSVYSNNFRAMSDGAWMDQYQFYPLESCVDNTDMWNDGQLFVGGPYGHMCTYDYTPIMAYHAARQFDSAITKFSYDVTDDIEFKLRAMYNRNETFGRYAPVADWFNVGVGDVDVLFCNGGVTTAIGTCTTASNEVAGRVYNRFVGSGPRADSTEDYMADIAMELIGDYQDYTWHLTANYNHQAYYSHGSGYVNREIYTSALNDPTLVPDSEGAYPHTTFDPNHPDFVNYYAQSIFANAESNYKFVSAGLSGPVEFIPGLDFFAGTEYYEYDFVNDYDDQSVAGNVMGSAGSDEGGGREVAAVYAEFQYTNVEDLLLNASVRYDSYSDFGNTTTYKVSGVYDLANVMGISEDLSVRASFGTGFIAPDLGALYQATAFSAEYAYDYAVCDFLAITCPEDQFETYQYGNDQLGAETSENFSAGVMGTMFGGDLRLRADYFWTEVENVIRYVSVQDLMNAQRADCDNGTDNVGSILASNPLVSVVRSGAGDACAGDGWVTGSTSFANSGSFDSSGIDGSATLVRDYDFGSFTFKADATYILEFNDELFVTGPMVDWIGTSTTNENAFPQWRGQLGAQFDRGDHSFSATVNYIDEYVTEAGDGETVESWTTFDLRYTWQSPWDATVSLGCRNCTNEDPPLTAGNGHNDTLHNIYGAVSYLSITANF